jgi:hypothetical protein
MPGRGRIQDDRSGGLDTWGSGRCELYVGSTERDFDDIVDRQRFSHAHHSPGA